MTFEVPKLDQELLDFMDERMELHKGQAGVIVFPILPNSSNLAIAKMMYHGVHAITKHFNHVTLAIITDNEKSTLNSVIDQFKSKGDCGHEFIVKIAMIGFENPKEAEGDHTIVKSQLKEDCDISNAIYQFVETIIDMYMRYDASIFQMSYEPDTKGVEIRFNKHLSDRLIRSYLMESEQDSGYDPAGRFIKKEWVRDHARKGSGAIKLHRGTKQ